jgi:hypothetical protein
MKPKEFSNIIAAIVILTIVIGFQFPFDKFLEIENLTRSFFFSAIIIFVSVIAKKAAASKLDADVEHEIWRWQRFGYKPHHYLKEGLPAGIVFPLFFSLFSLGSLKVMGLLNYYAAPLRRRAARRFGYFSYGELSEYHNGLIGAAGIAAVLVLSFVSYFIPGVSLLAKYSAYYAFWNMLPISFLDGTQIFFGSRVLWSTLALFTVIFTALAIIVP